MPRIAIRPPCAMFATPERSASALPDISSITSKPFCHPELALHVAEVPLPRVDRERRAHPPREVEPVGVEVGRDHMARACVPDDRDGHAADRAGARDEHVLAEHRERERRVHGVSERVEDRCDVLRAHPASGARRSSSGARRTPRTRPGRWTPSPIECAQSWRRPAMQLRHRPQTTWPSPPTRSPGPEVAHVRARPRRPRRRTRGRRRAAPGSSAAPTRPIGGCGRRCRRSPSRGRGS